MRGSPRPCRRVALLAGEGAGRVAGQRPDAERTTHRRRDAEHQRSTQRLPDPAQQVAGAIDRDLLARSPAKREADQAVAVDLHADDLLATPVKLRCR